jgi:long-chain fatty acid transport protein
MSSSLRGVLRPASAALALLLAPSPSRAAGFSLFEQGAKGMGFGGAFTAQASDPSAIFHNPAGIAFLRGKQLYLGGTAVMPTWQFDGANPFPGESVHETDAVSVLLPPAAYYSQPFSRRVAFGVGVNVPFGLKTEWANRDQFSGRYVSQKAALSGFGVNPTLAFKLEDRLAVGVGLDVRFSKVTLERRVPVINPFTQRPVDAADERLVAGTDTGIGFDVGVLAKFSDDVSFGASYRHKVKVDYQGTASFTPLPTGNAQLDARLLGVLPPESLNLLSSITFPALASGGLAFHRGDWAFEADVNWYQWSSFQSIPVTFPDRPDLSGAITEDYGDSFQYRFGVERTLNDRWAVRGGYYWDETPSPPASVSPLLPDSDRNGFCLGASWTSGKWRVDAASWLVLGSATVTTAPTRPARSRSASSWVMSSRRAGRGLTMPRLAGRAVLSVAAVLAAVSVGAQTNLTTYVALGDSLTAGIVNGSLVETHQRHSFPAILALQAGVTGFEQPLISDPGIPIELVLVTLTPPVVAAKAATPGAPLRLDLARPYNNLGVPGSTVSDLLTRTTDAGGFHDLILRGRGTALSQGTSLHPTTLTLWIGNNDVLGAAVRGQAIEGVTLTPLPVFRAAYQSVVTAVKASGAFVVAANIPDVTAVPFVTTIKPYVVSPSTGAPVLVNGQNVPLIGPAGALSADARVTLAASPLLLRGEGIPTSLGGTGRPLPDEVVLDPGELSAIRARIDQFNQAATIPVLDVHAFYTDVATRGRDVGGVTFTSAYLSGGLFGYDGVHPTELGYALLTNEWIRTIDARGGTLPLVDLGPYLGVGSASARAQARVRGAAAWTAFTAETYEELLATFPRLDGR